MNDIPPLFIWHYVLKMDSTTENACARALSPPSTTLNAFFTLCEDDMFAKTLHYSEVPNTLNGMQQPNISTAQTR